MENLNKLDQTSSASVSKKSKNDYTCEMHPEVHVDKQGTCPKCGMKLVQSGNFSESNRASVGCRSCSWTMILCCLLPIALVLFLRFFYPAFVYLPILVVLICPISFLLMMVFNNRKCTHNEKARSFPESAGSKQSIQQS